MQAPEGNTENMVTIGKVNLDLAQYVMDTTNQQTEMVPITYKVGSSSNGFIKLVINTTVLGDVADDAMTEVSGITGLTSQDGNREEQDLDGASPCNVCRPRKCSELHSTHTPTQKPRQCAVLWLRLQQGRVGKTLCVCDIAGFEHESPARSKSLKGSGNSASQASRAGRGGKAPLPTTREDTEDDNSSEEDSEPAARRQAGGASSSRGASADPFAKRVPGAPPPKPPPKPVWDDDISPVASDLVRHAMCLAVHCCMKARSIQGCTEAPLSCMTHSGPTAVSKTRHWPTMPVRHVRVRVCVCVCVAAE